MVVSQDKYLALQTTCQKIAWQVRLLQGLCQSHSPFRQTLVCENKVYSLVNFHNAGTSKFVTSKCDSIHLLGFHHLRQSISSSFTRRHLYTVNSYIFKYKNIHYIYIHVPRDSSACIAIRHGLEGPGIESRSGRDFLQISRPPTLCTQPPIQWVPSLSLG